MPEAFENWAHGLYDFVPIGVAIAIVVLIVDVGCRRNVSKKTSSWWSRDHRRRF